jgi:hypothetical protein
MVRHLPPSKESGEWTPAAPQIIDNWWAAGHLYEEQLSAVYCPHGKLPNQVRGVSPRILSGACSDVDTMLRYGNRTLMRVGRSA